MKKLLSFLLCIMMIMSFSVSAMAAENVGNRVGYIEYDIADLIGADSIATVTSTTANKETTAGVVEARTLGGATGVITGTSATFTFSGIPTNAVITNVQAWNPSKNNITQGKFTAIENIQVYHGSTPSGYFKFWVIDAPTTLYPCNTTALNGLLANATYRIQIQGRVASNVTGFDGFTVRGTKVRVTYRY
jgi:hypothetical protein